MGKTTTKFTNSIGTMISTCETHADDIARLYESRKGIVKDANVQIALMDGVAEKHMPGGMQTAGSEERVEKDPVYIKASAALDLINGQIGVVDGKLRTAKESLRGSLKALQTENDNFEKYVVKKKTKWFGTKNSVPAAEQCIKSTKEYIQDCIQLLR